MNKANIIFYLILLLFIQFIASCDKESVRSSEKPSPLTEYEVTPINGGAVITYRVPNDPNVLCVTAEYFRNGQKFIERSSYHKNSLRIEGFKVIEPVKVTLYTENSYEDRSDPVTIQFTPLKGLVDLAKESMKISTTFGGINVSWNNNSNTELRIHLLAYINGKLVKEEIYFSAYAQDNHVYRGYESVATKFAIVIGDKWQNVSDTIFYETTPIFEMEVPKPWGDMRAYVYGDNTTEYGPTHTFSKFFDGMIGWGSVGYLNKARSEGNSFTFDLKEEFILNRFKFWPSLRFGELMDVYGNVNLIEFSMWGSPVLDTTKPNSYWENNEDPTGTFKEDWVYLGYFVRERLDLQGATDAEIAQRGAVDGDEFILPENLGPVRYIRFFAEANAGGKPVPNNYWQLGELSFFGTNDID
ncbi:MAG: DUF4959 domain-containing protein [Petrimonas sp.]|jgi:hypothetical protein